MPEQGVSAWVRLQFERLRYCIKRDQRASFRSVWWCVLRIYRTKISLWVIILYFIPQEDTANTLAILLQRGDEDVHAFTAWLDDLHRRPIVETKILAFILWACQLGTMHHGPWPFKVSRADEPLVLVHRLRDSVAESVTILRVLKATSASTRAMQFKQALAVFLSVVALTDNIDGMINAFTMQTLFCTQTQVQAQSPGILY